MKNKHSLTAVIVEETNASENAEKQKVASRQRRIPTEAETDAFLKQVKTPAHIVLHQRRVAECALKIGQLYGEHLPVDLALLEAAASLHDMMRAYPDHAQKAALFLADKGFPEVGDVVAQHMELSRAPRVEAEILYLADKYVSETDPVPLEEREKQIQEKFANDSGALRAAMRRIRIARTIEKRIEKETGIDSLFRYLS